MQRFRFIRVAVRSWAIAGATILLILCRSVLAGEFPVLDGEVTIDRALEAAFANHPQLRAARAEIEITRGALRGAETYPYNPEVAATSAARTEADNTQGDLGVQLSQEIELPAKRDRRIAVAEAGITGTRARFQREARLLAARVHTTFVTALEARDLLAVANAELEIVLRVRDLAKLRLRRGATTQLELNLAEAELGRAEGRTKTAAGTYRIARVELAAALGVSPLHAPAPSGTLEANGLRPPVLADLALTALENRSDVLALRAFEQQSSAAHALARVSAWPNLTLGAFAAREGERETIIGGQFSIPLPIFQRSQGRIAVSRADIVRAEAVRVQGELVALRELAATHAAYEAAAATAERLRARVFGTLQDNLELLEKAFSAGKTTWPEVLVIRRNLVDAQREMVRAEATTRRAWIALELAAGRMPVPEFGDEHEETT